MGNTLIAKGKLRGMGCDAECSLIVTRVDALKGTGDTYTKCAILDAPLWLPDGYYEAVFSGQSAFLHRVNGVWSVGIPWRQEAKHLESTPDRQETETLRWAFWRETSAD